MNTIAHNTHLLMCAGLAAARTACKHLEIMLLTVAEGVGRCRLRKEHGGQVVHVLASEIGFIIACKSFFSDVLLADTVSVTCRVQVVQRTRRADCTCWCKCCCTSAFLSVFGDVAMANAMSMHCRVQAVRREKQAHVKAKAIAFATANSPVHDDMMLVRF